MEEGEGWKDGEVATYSFLYFYKGGNSSYFQFFPCTPR